MFTTLSYDDFIAAQFAGRTQVVTWSKSATATGVNWGVTLWPHDGNPTSGSYGPSGNANGRVCTMATSGAIQFATASAGRDLYLTWATYRGQTTQNTVGMVALYDRLSDCVLPHSCSSGSISGLDATNRLEPGEGAKIMIEVINSGLVAGNAFQIEYTNQDGVSGRFTPVFTSGVRSQNQLLTEGLYVPLQNGDSGVKSIQGIFRTAGSNTGTMAIVLVRPVVEIPITSVGVKTYRTFLDDLRFCPKLTSASCLYGVMAIPANAVPAPQGDLFIVEI